MVTRRQVRRATRPSLAGTVVRTAVITKTATTVAGASAAKQQQAAAAAAPAEAAPVEAQAAPAPDRMDQLRQLGELKAAGILTDEEFEAEKAKILNS